MPNPPQCQSHKAELFRSLHTPGKPLVLSNVWDSISARTVASAEGVRALATASHAISEMHGVRDGDLDLETAILWARIISTSVDLPVSIDFEKGYAPTADGVARNVRRLIEETQAAGLNIEDTIDADATLYSLTEASDRISAARRGVEESGVPAVIAARVDALVVEPENWDGAIERANAYLLAGADLVFVRRLATEAQVVRALNEIDGPLSVICNPSSVPLSRLAELGVARVSFGPAMMGLAQSALSSAAATVTALGEYPPALSFPV